MSYARSFKVTVTVAAGVGTGSFTFPNVTGVMIRTLIIDAPSAATYDWYLRDSESYAIAGQTGSSGDETHALDLPISGDGTINFVNATNGTYVVKIWAEYT